MSEINVNLVTESSRLITIGWQRPAGQIGYVPTIDGSDLLTDGKRHPSYGPTAAQATEVRIGKPADETTPASKHTYGVILLESGTQGSYDPSGQPEPEPEPEPTPGWVEVWHADGKFSEWTYPFDGGQHNPQNNGAGVVTEDVQGGVPCLKHYGPSDGSNTRVFEMPRRADGQWSWPDEELMFEAKYQLPQLVTGNWNCFQFKSKEIGGQGRNEPFFSFNLVSENGKYRLRVYHKPDGTGAGAYWLPELAGQPTAAVGEWFTVRARLVQSALGTKKGQLDVWLNDVQTHKITGVDTKYGGTSTQTWSVNLYGATTISRPATQYTTGHRVSRRA